MPDRGQSRHRARMEEELLHELTAMVEGELGDPRIGLAAVSEVHLARDGRSALVFVAVDGDEQEAERTLQGLAAAAGYIRHQLAERLRLRVAPELIFQLDRSQEYGTRIEQLLRRVEKRRRS